jgi:hypothetical protein
MSDSLSLSTKGRIFSPESKASQGVLFKRGLFDVYGAIKAKFVFVRDAVTRVFDRGEAERVFDRDDATITRWYK